MTGFLLQVCTVTLLAATTTQAFSVAPANKFVSTLTPSSTSAFAFSLPSRGQPLFMAESEGAEDSKSEVETDEEAVEADLLDDEPVVELTEPAADADVEAEDAEPAEDPELVALKEEISTMEKTLKERRVQVALTADTADEFSSAGYARKVAEMEMMRRNKRVSTYYDTLKGCDGMSCVL
jgi:hypothetical protein